MTDSKFHPALGVSNIKNHISIILSLEKVQYSTWAELFKVFAKSHKVLHHIISNGKAVASPSDEASKDQWETLDATVLGWIYITITNDLLKTIIEPDAIAMEAWNRLRDIFQDNKHSRAVSIEQEFSHTLMEDFSSATLKELSDQLRNVDSPVSNDRLVLQMVSGLTEAYNSIGTIIRQKDPLPLFNQARSMVILEEADLAKKAATASTGTVLVAAGSSPFSPPSANSFGYMQQQSRPVQGGNRGQNKKKGHRNNNNNSRGGGNGNGRGNNPANRLGSGGSTNQWQHPSWGGSQ
ncbi:uncharacterized protein [Euphorbia lathyris]|uniref:uncharacterized protein n=1 Tax=Euphorbia lathyris TaxID=212925 RepID=UPI00331421A6